MGAVSGFEYEKRREVEDEMSITRLLCSISAAATLAVTAAHADEIDWKKELGDHSGKTLRVMTITDPFIDSIKKTKDGFTKLTGANVEVDGYGYDALHEKELLSCSQNDASYDVLIIDGIWIGEFSDAGCIDSAEDHIARAIPRSSPGTTTRPGPPAKRAGRDSACAFPSASITS
jgi:maltose-binding protein MalE